MNEPNHIEDTKQWLAKFEHFLRQRDWRREPAEGLFQNNMVAFGLECNAADSLERFAKEEFNNFSQAWRGFTFGLGAAKLIPLECGMCVCVPWRAQSPIDGAPDKIGRATIVLIRFNDNKLLCVHIHLSLEVKA